MVDEVEKNIDAGNKDRELLYLEYYMAYCFQIGIFEFDIQIVFKESCGETDCVIHIHCMHISYL